MLGKSLFFKLITLIFFSQNIFANIEIITKDFDGQIDDNITNYYYDHKTTSLFYLNKSLKLNIINFRANKVNFIQLSVEKDFLSKIPINWVPNIALNANKELVDSQFKRQIHQKISDLEMIMSNNELFLIDNGGGMVLKIDLNNYEIIRHDGSFTTMNKFGGNVFTINEDIYHFGGYGLYATNSTLLKFNKKYKTWDEIIVKNKFPIVEGITNARTLIWDNKLYLIGGNSTQNQVETINNQLLSFDFNNKSWKSHGLLDFNINDGNVISTVNNYFFVYNSELSKLKIIDVNSFKMSSYTIENNIEFKNGDDVRAIIFNCSHLYTGSKYKGLSSTVDLKFTPLNEITINYFVGNTRTYQASIFKSYKMFDFVDLKSKENLVLFKESKSRSEFLIPIIIVLVILILNTFYKNYKKGKDIIIQKLYSFEDGVLLFKNKVISLDENSKIILELLYSNNQVSSNDVVALLVNNGMSMDYASKIKNKTIERLNEKFEFITGSTEKFIQTLKSKEDKRIQLIQLLKD
jgi:hypothetical protein